MARFVASVMLVSGVLLIADVAVTLLWQEPVSALVAAREQDRLEDDLAAQTEDFAALPRPSAPDAGDDENAGAGGADLAAAARAYGRRVDEGGAFGRIVLPAIDASFVVAEGTDPATLRKAPGHYPGSGLPGMREPVAVAGHRTTYGAPFADLDDLRRGDRIVLDMPYGRFTYRMREQRIVDPDAVWVTQRGTDRLVLTTCHPPFSAAQRLVIVADLVDEQA